MRVVIIGSGNVASVLGRALQKNNHEIIQVISRTSTHAKVLANELSCNFSDNLADIDKSAELFLLAVSDGALYSLEKSFNTGNKPVLHTAGSVPKDILKNISTNYGVLYPLQSLLKDMEYPQHIPFLVDGNSEEVITLAEDFAKTISGTVAKANDEERLKLHVAAVTVSNFTNHLYALTEEFCERENVNFKLLFPLIKETASRLDNHSPAKMQTGPAVRNDIFTLDKHLRILANHPRLKYMYLKITDSIMNG
jgi:predicted short-subunit dehydrogenase-like oxidoreductase (DUF2520 family)